MNNITTDIVIVGGGIAGFAAAIAAAGENKKVMLLDRNPDLGGDSVNANVGTICGAYIRSPEAPRLAGYPFSRLFIDALNKVCETAKPVAYHQGLYIIPYEWTALRSLYSSMLHAHQVDIRINTNLDAVQLADGRIKSFTASSQESVLQIECSAVVDCSGNAIVSQLAGLETIKDKSYQAASQIFRITAVSSKDEFALNMSLKRAVMRNMQGQGWPSSYSSLSVVPGSLRDNKADLKLVLPDIITDNAEENKKLIKEGRRRATEVFNIIKTDMKSLEHAQIERIFPQPGIRVLQRSKGMYILTEEDILTCRKFNDSIATGTWPIEEWSNNGEVNMEYFPMNKFYTIPAGTLISERIDNLFFAGKNISATSRAIASARVMGTALQTGYAAGKIACGRDKKERNTIINSLHHELD